MPEASYGNAGDNGFTGGIDPLSQGDPLGDPQTSKRMKFLTQYLNAGSLTPAHAYAMASDPSVSDDHLHQLVGQAIHFGNAVKVANEYRGLTRGDAVGQLGVSMQKQWDDMDPFKQQFLREMGITPPRERFHALDTKMTEDAKHANDGFSFSDIYNTPLDAIGTALSAPAEFVGDRLHNLDQLGHAVTHVRRAITYFNESEGGPGANGKPGGPGDAIQWLLDPSKLSDAWEQTGTGNGEDSYLPHVKRKARDQAGTDDNYTIAKELAHPDTESNVVEAANKYAERLSSVTTGSPEAKTDPKYQKAFTTFMDSANLPRTQAAADYLRHQKMSFGRDVARGAGLDPTKGDGAVISGLSDFAYSYVMDPTILAGKAFETYRAAKNGIDAIGYAAKMDQVVNADTLLNARAAARGTTDILDKNYLKELHNADLSKQERDIVMAHDVMGPALDADTARRWGAYAHYSEGNGIKTIPLMRDIDLIKRIGASNVGPLDLASSLGRLEREQALAGAGQTIVTKAGETFDQAAGRAVDFANRSLSTAANGKSFQSPEELAQYLRDSPAAKLAVIDGDWGQHLHSYTALPELTKMGVTRLRAKLAIENGINKLSDVGRNYDKAMQDLIGDKLIADPLAMSENFTPMSRLLMGVQSGGAHFAGAVGDVLRSTIHQLPTNPGAVSLHGDDALPEMTRWLNTGKLTTADYELYLGRILTAESVPAKRAAMTAAMSKVFDSLGVSTKAGEWGNDMLTRMGGENANKFSISDDVGSLMLGGRQTASPVYASQVADDFFPIPDFKETMQHVDQAGLFRTLRDGNSKFSLNGDDSIFDASIQHVWKVAAVARLAFVPRAIIEEMMPWVGRAGAMTSFRQQWLAPLWNEPTEAKPVMWALRPLAAIERRFGNADYAAQFAKQWGDTLEGAAHGLDSGVVPALSMKGQAALSDTRKLLFKANLPNIDDLKSMGGKLTLDENGDVVVNHALRRMVGYNDGEAKMTQHLQNNIAAKIAMVWSPAEVRSLRMLGEDPGLRKSYLDEITTNAQPMDVGPTQQSGIGAYVQERQGTKLKTIPMVKTNGEHGFDLTAANMADPAVRNSIEHIFGSVSQDLVARAAASHVYVEPQVAAQIHAQLGLDAKTADPVDDGYHFIDSARRDYTALTPEQRRGVDDLWRALPQEMDARKADLADKLAWPKGTPDMPFDDGHDLGYALNRWRQLTNDQRATLMHRLDQHFDAVGGMAPVEGTPWDKAGLVTRDEFRSKVTDVQGRVHAHELDPTMATPQAKRQAVEEWSALRGSPEYKAALAKRDPNDPFFVDQLYDEMLATKNKMILDPHRVAPVFSSEQRAKRADLVDAALRDPVADQQLRQERVMEALRDPRNVRQWSKAHGSRQLQDGTPLMTEVPEHHQRYYGIMMPEDKARDVALALEQHPGSSESEMTGIVDGYKRLRGAPYGDVQGTAPMLSDPSQYNLLSAWVTNNPEEARAQARMIHERTGIDLSHITIGETDLPDRLTGPLHQSMARFPVPTSTIPVPQDYIGGSRHWRFGDDIDALRDTKGSHVTGASAAIGATKEEVDQDAARRAMADMDLRLTGRDGQYNQGVGQMIHSGTYHPYDAARVDPDMLPTTAYGPDLYRAPKNLVDEFARFAFDKVLTPPISAVVRQPMFMDRAIKAHMLIDREMRPMLLGADHLTESDAIAHAVLGEGHDGTDMYDLMHSFLADLHGRRDLTGTIGDRFQGVKAAIGDGRQPPINDELFHIADDMHMLEGKYAPLKHMLDASTEEMSMLNRTFSKEQDTRQLITNASFKRAYNDVQPYIVDHRVRSQTADHMRNIFPFWFALEQFYKRMARTVLYDPTYPRKVQLLLHAMDASGFSHKNEYGDQVFTYPGSGMLQETVGRMANLTGAPASVPFQVPLTGQVKYSTPGFADIGIPSASPLLSVPLGYLANHYPELQPAVDTVLGPRSSGRSVIEQVFPASVTHVASAIMNDANSSREFAVAQNGVLMLMEANATGLDQQITRVQGKLVNLASPKDRAPLDAELSALQKQRNATGVPGDNATPAEIETWLERTKNWTRTMLISKALLGFTGPASPSAEFPNQIHAEYRSLLQSLPVSEATAKLIELHPDATPYTVFSTNSVSRAALPATEQGKQWIDGHQDFLNRYPMAGPWLIPQEKPGDEYSQEAYNDQIAQHLRVTLGPREQWEEMKFAKAAEPYFRMRDAYEVQREAIPTADIESRKNLDGQWAIVRDAFMNQHPIFAEKLRTPKASMERQQIRDQMQKARFDTAAPDSARSPLLSQLVDRYDTFTNKQTILTYSRSGSAQDAKEMLRKQFFNWGTKFTHDHPEYLALWQRVYRPDIGLDNAQLDTLQAQAQPMQSSIVDSNTPTTDTSAAHFFTHLKASQGY